MIQYDILLEDIGTFGLAQIVICLLLSYYDVSIGMNALATVFIQQAPESSRYVIFDLRSNPKI